MKNTNYLITTSDEGMYYLLIDKKYTPQEIIHDVASNNTVLKDDKLGVEPCIAHMFATHTNSTGELMKIYHDNFDNHEDIQDDFNELMLAVS